MAGDLKADDAQVHDPQRRDLAGQVLDFWFAMSKEQHFAKDAALDRKIRDRFGALRDELLATEAAGWRNDPDALLAAVIVLDQFSRNMHRGTARAFEADGLAVELTLGAIDRGWEQRYPPDRRIFLYMPLMHAEDARLQALSIEKFTELGSPENLAFARDHADVITRFGRFPSRNAAMGRESSIAEAAYLSQRDADW